MLFSIKAMVRSTGVEPACPAQDFGFKDRSVYQFRHERERQLCADSFASRKWQLPTRKRLIIG